MPKKPKRTIEVDWALVHIRAVTARQLAAGFVTGVDHASGEGHALTQLQQCDMLTMQIMAYHDAITELTDSLDMEWQLSKLKKEAGQ